MWKEEAEGGRAIEIIGQNREWNRGRMVGKEIIVYTIFRHDLSWIVSSYQIYFPYGSSWPSAGHLVGCSVGRSVWRTSFLFVCVNVFVCECTCVCGDKWCINFNPFLSDPNWIYYARLPSLRSTFPKLLHRPVMLFEALLLGKYFFNYWIFHKKYISIYLYIYIHHTWKKF